MMTSPRAALVLLSIAGISCGDSRAPSSYSNQVSGAFKDDFFLTNMLAKDFLKSRDFLRKDKNFSPRNRRPWFQSSYYRSHLYPSSYSSSSINEIPLTRDDHEEEKAIFTYDESDVYGPHNWGLINQNCDGENQSPVNLYESSAKTVDSREPLIFDGLNNIPDSITGFNNGHAAAMKFNFTDGPIRLLGGPLSVPYILDNVHWHWGKDDNAGSEHTLNARRYSAEVHFVTFNSVYETLAEAMTKPKGLAVLGFVYELDNTNIDQLPAVKLLPNIIEPETNYKETKNLFSMNDLIKNKNFNYLSYKGSLTTPACLETVTWLVSTTPLKISSADLAAFRKIKDEKGNFLVENYRPLQRLNYRRVLSY